MNKGFLYSIITNKKITLFVTLLIYIGGIFSYMTSIKQESPDFDIPVAIINLSYVGASADEVENEIIKPLELELSQIEKIKDFTTYSRHNGGSLFIEFEYDVDRRQAFDEVRRRLDDMLLILPDDLKIENILAGELSVTDFMYVLTGSNEDVDMRALKDKASEIKDAIGDYEMVRSAHIQGEREV